MSNTSSAELRKKFKLDMCEIFNSHAEILGVLKADHIGYRQFLSTGETMYYCSTEQYIESFIEPEEMMLHYAKEILLISREGYNCILRSPSAANNSFLQKLLLLDLCNSLIVYQMEDSTIHMFCFIFSSSNLSASNHFINKRELFENIVSECKNKVSAICEKKEYSSLRENLFTKKIAEDIFFKIKFKSSLSFNAAYTQRQKQILSLLKRGATNKDISKKLHICVKTVEYHISNLKNKAGCHNRFGITEKVTI